MPNKTDDLDWSKSFMYSLHQTYFLAQKRLEQRLHEAKGLTFSQFLILLGLHCNAKASQTELADFLYLTEPTVSRHIAGLAKSKYLTRKEDPHNRRKHILHMTPQGAKAFASAHRIIVLELKDIFKNVPNKHRALITDVFADIITTLTGKA